MSEKYNQAFSSAPFKFVESHPINNVSMKLVEEKFGSDFKPDEFDKETGRLAKSHFKPYKQSVDKAKASFDVAKMGMFDIEPRAFMNCTNYYLRYYNAGMCPKLSEQPVIAYWCPYDMMQGDKPGEIPFVDLPKAGPSYPLMLTGSMQGCSLVVTLPAGQPTILRVYHDFLHKTHSFKNEVVVCRIDYTDEGYASANKLVGLKPSSPRELSLPKKEFQTAYEPEQHDVYKPVGLPPQEPSKRKGASVLIDEVPCVRFSYGDIEAFNTMDSEGTHASSRGVKLSTAFNFLYFDVSKRKWVAVSQPLDFDFSGSPKQMLLEPKFYFDYRQDEYNSQVQKIGQTVALAPRRPPWQSVIPY